MKEGWKMVKLGEVCEIYNGNSINESVKKKKYTKVSKPSRPFIATKDVSNDKVIDYANGISIPIEETSFKVAFPETTLICAEGGSAGKKLGLLTQEVCFGNKLFAVKPTNVINGKFVFYFLQSGEFLDAFKKEMTGIIGGVSKKKFEQISLSLPPLSEQTRIVSLLDDAFGKLERSREKALKLLDDAKEIFQAQLKKEMTPKEGWEVKKLGDVTKIIRGPFGGSLTKSCFKPSGYAVYEQQNAIYNRFDFRYFIDDEKFNELKRFAVLPNDIIMSCAGTMGKVSIVPQGAKLGVINQALMKITTYSEIDNIFLLYFLRSSIFQDVLNGGAKGAAMKNVASVSEIKASLIPLPPLSEQSAIVSRLDVLSSQLKQIEEKTNKYLADLDELKQSLLKKAFEGKL